MPNSESLLDRVTGPLTRLWRERRRTPGSSGGDATVAPRDGGWAELLSQDGNIRYGRGHLMIWPAGPGVARTSGEPAVDVGEANAQPTGTGGPDLRGELRSFTEDAGPPPQEAPLVVRPEREQDRYAVIVRSYAPDQAGGVVTFDWPDEELPAALRELGGF